MNDFVMVSFFLNLFREKKRLISFMLFASFMIGYALSLFIVPTYKSQIVLIASTKGRSQGGSAPKGAGSLGMLFGQLNSLSSDREILALLKSKTVAKRVIDLLSLKEPISKSRFRFVDYFFSKNLPQDILVKKFLSRNVSINTNKKDGTIVLETTFQDADLSAKVANAFLIVLESSLKDRNFTSARRNRIFLEKEVSEQQQNLLMKAKEIDSFFDRNAANSSRINVPIQIIEDELVSKNAGPSDLLDTKTLEDYLRYLREPKKHQAHVSGVPSRAYYQILNDQYMSLKSITEVLNSQIRSARSEELWEEPSFEVLDFADAASKAAGPSRLMFAIITSILGLFVGFFVLASRKFQKFVLTP